MALSPDKILADAYFRLENLQPGRRYKALKNELQLAILNIHFDQECRGEDQIVALNDLFSTYQTKAYRFFGLAHSTLSRSLSDWKTHYEDTNPTLEIRVSTDSYLDGQFYERADKIAQRSPRQFTQLHSELNSWKTSDARHTPQDQYSYLPKPLALVTQYFPKEGDTRAWRKGRERMHNLLASVSGRINSAVKIDIEGHLALAYWQLQTFRPNDSKQAYKVLQAWSQWSAAPNEAGDIADGEKLLDALLPKVWKSLPLSPFKPQQWRLARLPNFVKQFSGLAVNDHAMTAGKYLQLQLLNTVIAKWQAYVDDPAWYLLGFIKVGDSQTTEKHGADTLAGLKQLEVEVKQGKYPNSAALWEAIWAQHSIPKRPGNTRYQSVLKACKKLGKTLAKTPKRAMMVSEAQMQEKQKSQARQARKPKPAVNCTKNHAKAAPNPSLGLNSDPFTSSPSATQPISQFHRPPIQHHKPLGSDNLTSNVRSDFVENAKDQLFDAVETSSVSST